jgi:hypothetical protein
MARIFGRHVNICNVQDLFRGVYDFLKMFEKKFEGAKPAMQIFIGNPIKQDNKNI